MNNRKPEMETEPFRAFRLAGFEAQRLSDGDLLGLFLRCIVELGTRDQSGAAVDHLRHQADLFEAMLPPRAERPPAPKRHPWRQYPRDRTRTNTWSDGEPKAEKRPKVMAADKLLINGAAKDSPFGGEDDTTPGKCRDRKYEDEKLTELVEAQTEKEAAFADEEEQLEKDLMDIFPEYRLIGSEMPAHGQAKG